MFCFPKSLTSSTMPSQGFAPRPCHFFIFQVGSHEPFQAACQDVSVIGSERKRPRGLRGAFDSLYCAVSVSGVAAGVLAGGRGEVAGAVGVICSVKPLPPEPAEGLITFITSEKIMMAITKPQVPFSNISPVRFTPIRLVPPAKPEANPPPFGF